MVNKSKENIIKSNSKNIEILWGNSEKLDFPEGSFDVVISLLSRWKVSEIHRVLKEKGMAIIENHGGGDKLNLKKEFGKDEKGWRGQFMELNKEETLALNQNLFTAYFPKVTTKEGSWNTYYTLEGLTMLLENTPLIRNFDLEKDASILDTIRKKYMTEKGIKTTQSRILIIAKK